jgi:hypothetical protein
MLDARSRSSAFALHAMANLEGLTLQRGELTTGAFGEGYVDRRHPHSYVHELMLSAQRRVGASSWSLAAGRGFAPFGSDDPLVRPLAKFPVNHHHSQILERVSVIVAGAIGPLIGEIGAFNGDEPVGPASEPRWNRFGDSWSTRVTWRPGRDRSQGIGLLELSGSYAAVRSPEDPDRIIGLDQRKWHASARLERPTTRGRAYLLAEWAHTAELTDGRPVFRYESALVEGALCGRRITTVLRLERTERHEAQRLADLFRFPVPHDDASIIGVTRWTVATVGLGTAARSYGVLHVAPFAEAGFHRPEDRIPLAAFESRGFYGSRSLWTLSAGARLGVGRMHGRMGRYGVAASTGVHLEDEMSC